MDSGKNNRVTVRLPDDVLTFLQEQVQDKHKQGIKDDMTKEIVIAVRQRMISKLTPAQRVKLYKRLGMETDGGKANVETGCGDDVSPGEPGVCGDDDGDGGNT